MAGEANKLPHANQPSVSVHPKFDRVGMHGAGTGWLQSVVQVPHLTVLWLLCSGVESKHKLSFWGRFCGPASPLPSHSFAFPITQTAG